MEKDGLWAAEKIKSPAEAFLGGGVKSIIDMCINNLYRDVEKLAM